MTTYTVVTAQGRGKLMTEAKELGRGGEGSVYAVMSHECGGKLLAPQNLVAKVYHNPEEGDRRGKIAAMVKNQPSSKSLAWPLGVLFDEAGTFKGYVMERLKQNEAREWLKFLQTRDRDKLTADFNVLHALTASYNLGLAIKSVHDAGHRLGDINESNIFIRNDIRVLIVDTDSAQIQAPNGKVFPCLVGKPDFTAPEISHGSFRDNPRTLESEVFAYAVLTYQLLVGGAHPTNGRVVGDGDPPEMIERIRMGAYPNLAEAEGDLKRNATYSTLRPVPRIPAKGIPQLLRTELYMALSVDPQARPTLDRMLRVLRDVIDNLKQCPQVASHYYDRRDHRCGWCSAATIDVWDPYGKNFGKSETKKPEVNPEDLMDFYDYKGHRISIGKLNGVTLLEHTDGSVRQRPDLISVWRQNPLLAVKCFINELPEFARFSWKVGDKVPTWKPLTLAFLTVAVILGVAMLLLPLWVSSYGVTELFGFSMRTLITGALSVGALALSWHYLSGLLEAATISRMVNAKGVPEATYTDALRRFARTAGFYGGALVFILGVILIVFILRGHTAVLMAQTPSTLKDVIDSPKKLPSRARSL